MEIELSSKVSDSITGFKGVVVARCEYLNGCISYEVQGSKAGETYWFDEQRLTEESNADVGGTQDIPPALHP